jgi:hypothetical protein
MIQISYVYASKFSLLLGITLEILVFKSPIKLKPEPLAVFHLRSGAYYKVDIVFLEHSPEGW